MIYDWDFIIVHICMRRCTVRKRENKERPKMTTSLLFSSFSFLSCATLLKTLSIFSQYHYCHCHFYRDQLFWLLFLELFRLHLCQFLRIGWLQFRLSALIRTWAVGIASCLSLHLHPVWGFSDFCHSHLEAVYSFCLKPFFITTCSFFGGCLFFWCKASSFADIKSSFSCFIAGLMFFSWRETIDPNLDHD